MSYPSDCGIVENLLRDVLKEECDQTTSLGAMEREFLSGREERNQPTDDEIYEETFLGRL